MKKHIYPEMILFEKDIAQNVYISKNNFKNYELHSHDFYELEFFVEGNGLCEINGKEYSFRKGDISFVTPLDIHGYKGDDNVKTITIHFRLANLNQIFSSVSNIKAGLIKSTEEIRNAFNILITQNSMDTFYNLLCEKVLETILILLLQKVKTPQRNALPKEILAAVEYINLNFKNNINLNVISKYAGYSQEHFSRQFTKYMGIGFSDYLTQPITGAVLEDKIMKWLPPELITERRAEKIQETDSVKQNNISDNIIEEKRVHKCDDMQNNDISDESLDNKESVLSPDDIYAKLGSMAEVDLAAAEQYSFDGMDGVLANYAIYKDAIDEIRNKLIKAYEDKDYKNYEIVVHSIKSNLAMIGVNGISAMAKELEMASKASETDVVEAKHLEFIKVWDAFNAVIKEFDFPEEFVPL